MTTFLRSLQARADAWSPKALLLANLVMALLVTVAHGGALLLSRRGGADAPDALAIEALTTVSLPLAAFVVLTACVGLLARNTRIHVLGVHGAVLGIAVVVQLWWAAELILLGLPEENFSWSVGLFSASIAYGVLVFTRYTLPSRFRIGAAWQFAPLLALGVAAVIDVGVFVRAINEFTSGFGA